VRRGLLRRIGRFFSLSRIHGPGRALGVAAASLRRRRASRRAHRRLGHRYPRSLIFLASLPRSGSNWLASLLASLAGFERFVPSQWPELDRPECGPDAREPVYPGLVREFEGLLAVVKGHTWGTPRNVQALREQGIDRHLVGVRDPRDALISAYWYVRLRPHDARHARVMSVSLEEYVDTCLSQGLFARDFVGWLDSWLRNRDPDGSLVVRYEDLLADTPAAFERVLGFLRLPAPREEVARIVASHAFEAVTGRPPGEADPSSVVRRAVSGEWREVFSAEQAARARSLAGSVLDALGYE
jgi:alcohol sulfotransferase